MKVSDATVGDILFVVFLVVVLLAAIGNLVGGLELEETSLGLSIETQEERCR